VFPTHWPRAPRHVITLFLLIALTPILALAWLSWRMIQQDRALEAQRIQERCEHAADLAVSRLQRFLGELEEQFSSFAGGGEIRASLPGVALVAFAENAPDRAAGASLPYYPSVSSPNTPPADVFAAGEVLEFRERDLMGAAAVYRQLTRSTDPAIRAGAWIRLARSYRNLGDFRRALSAYQELEKLGATPVSGEPAELLALQGRATLFRDWRKKEDLAREASALASGLAQGRWPVSRASYFYLTETAQQWLGERVATPRPAGSLALSGAVEAIWSDWKDGQLAGELQRGRRTVWAHGTSVLLLWRATKASLAVLAAGPAGLARHSAQELGNIPQGGLRFVLEDAEGRLVLGQPEKRGQRPVVRTVAATGLPWTVYAVAAAAPGSQLSGRAQLLLAGLLLMVGFTLASGYFVARAIARELAVARLQSDFVAAVSHDFRTPLTTLMQLSEMLVRGRVSSDDRRREFYATLHNESRRLHQLVERLLNFGLLEAGQAQFGLEPLELGLFVKMVVEEFRHSMAESEHRIEFDSPGEPVMARADREALGTVLWNLLDNAVKYSPQGKTISVQVTHTGRHGLIKVKDQGVGIPVHEQKEIFRKFVRGAAARSLSVKGTGIGLAAATMIVAAHGGEITVESAPGQGSTFRVALPAVE